MVASRLTGLLGGAFDPPHAGHLVLAATALDHFGLARLVVVVTGDPPHKPVETDAETRYRLAEAAFAGLPRVELSRYELDADGPSYTERTVRFARDRYGDVVFLVGADEFASFLDWHDPEGVLEAARLGVATRPGYPRERLEAVLEHLPRRDRVVLFEIPAVPVSSSEVRERVARGEPVDGLVPPAVARLIADLGLYRGELTPIRTGGYPAGG
jgi:nicotinate-nucleotide adenylyltransferase